MLPLRYESSGFVQSPIDQVFAHLDDHTRLSSHMSERSWRTGGGRMETEIDEGRGQTVGSRIRLSGRVLGVELSVEEIVVRARSAPPQGLGNHWRTEASCDRSLPNGLRAVGPEGTVRCSASSSNTRCRSADPPVGLDACSAGTTQGGVPSRWSTTPSITSRRGPQRNCPTNLFGERTMRKQIRAVTTAMAVILAELRRSASAAAATTPFKPPTSRSRPGGLRSSTSTSAART